MLYEEVEKYARLSGDKNALNTSVSRIGGYLDGYDKGLEVLDKIRSEIETEKLEDSPNFCVKAHNNAVDRVLGIIDKYKAETEADNGNDRNN